MTWEERWHPLREEWVVVAAHRQGRPWSGACVDSTPAVEPAPYDPECHFCPGNRRVGGIRNPEYDGVYVFDNDHPCVGPEAPVPPAPPAGLYRNRPARGLARVVCFTPRHDLSLAQLEIARIDRLLEVLAEQHRELGRRDGIEHVLTFENRGALVGVSNPHPHCQIYATNFVFATIARERDAGQRHLRATGRVLYQDILAAERADGRRIICEHGSALAFIPYFARYAYEVHVAPSATHESLASLAASERADLARVLKDVLLRFEQLWRQPFPYVMAFHQAPTDGGDSSGFHFHVEFHPPLRSKHLLKYLAGPEIGGGNFLSDTSPEEKAHELKDCDGL